MGVCVCVCVFCGKWTGLFVLFVKIKSKSLRDSSASRISLNSGSLYVGERIMECVWMISRVCVCVFVGGG